MKTVYLAGPILGLDKGQANDWRNMVRKKIAHAGIQGISPLRCEPLIGPRYSLDYPDPKFGTARAIAAKNRHDVMACDITLCYMPKSLPFSKGTLVELAWANAYDKQTILVSDDEATLKHPCIDACASWVLNDLEDAIEVIIGVLGDYAHMV
jgi:nucleoside 2-deoxyribosyltransferase